jgi:drug/metabolite transporter (DMT)-like permease
MSKSNKIIISTLALFMAIFIFYFPRMLISYLGTDNPWTSYFYQYAFAFLYFGSGILLALRSKACQPGRGRDSLWLALSIGGFIFLAVFQGVWVYMSIHWPFKG